MYHVPDIGSAIHAAMCRHFGLLQSGDQFIEGVLAGSAIHSTVVARAASVVDLYRGGVISIISLVLPP